MSGLKLAEMDISDMLDVIHYFYEEDFNYSTVEQAQMTDARRIHVFESLYKTKYHYAAPKTKESSSGPDGTDYDYDGQEIKPFVPATDFNPEAANPFGGLLDAPIG